MKLVSTLSLGLMLAIGATGLTAAAPAAAAKKEKEKAPEGPKFALSKEFRAAIGPAQASIKAGTLDDAKTKLAAAEALVKNGDEKYVLSAVRLELASALKDQTMQAAAVNGMIASGSAPAADLPRLHYFAGEFAYVASDFANALKFFAEAERLGYKNVDMYLRQGEANFKLNKVTEGLVFVDKAVAEETAAGKKPPEAWYMRAASVAFKAKMPSEVSKWTRAAVRAYPTVENWRSALVSYRDSTRLDGQLQLDVFRLMHDTKSLAGERDFYEYASLAIERALPGEAKTAIDDGFASGAVSKASKPIQERLVEANGKIPADKASVASDAKKATTAPDGRLAANTAGAFLAYGDNAKAIELFRLALQKGGVDADAVNTRLGIALARSGQKEEARKAFSSVGGARSEIAKFWLLWLDVSAA